MYTSVIGKRFLQYYNKTFNLKLTAKDFFEDVWFPLFYDDAKYLQSPANTPLFQVIAHKKLQDANARKKAFKDIVEKIDSFENEKIRLPDMSFALGYASGDICGTTSGQVTTMELPFDSEDMYASWIGAGFGIGAGGGLNILLDSDEIFSALYQGFNIYRNYINENAGIENKIETWNGIWLVHRFSANYDEAHPTANFHPISSAKDGKALMERASWAGLLFSMSKVFPDENVNAYIYSFGQMNKTVGFVRIHLSEVHSLAEIYNLLYGRSAILSNKQLGSIYETEYSFSAVCERYSVIGLRALEPKDLRKFMPGKYGYSEIPKLKNDEKSLINYSIYITWVIAMLNNKEILELAEKTALSFREYEKRGRTGKVTRDNEIKTLLAQRNRKDLIEKLTDLVENEPDMSKTFNDVVQSLMVDIAADNIPLFVTLIRFKYTMVNEINN